MSVIPTNLLGQPREGIRQIRIPFIDWSLFDTLLTVAAAIALTQVSWASSHILINFIILLIVGQLFHFLAGLDIEFARMF